MRSINLVLLLLAGFFASSQNKPDTIRPGNLNLKYLPAGTQSYLVYIKTKEGDKKNIWLWERTVSHEPFNGKDAIVIRQQWTTSDTGFNRRQILSVVNANDFTPVYHTSVNPKTGREAFNYYPDKMVTADTVTGVTRKDFSITLDQPSFNWELDLETFPLLPLKEGKSFVINFYHPGSKSKPDWYIYSVTGSEKIKTVNESEVDCYKLFIDYGNNRGNSTWWLSKKLHEVIKMEEHFGPMARYKIKLAATE